MTDQKQCPSCGHLDVHLRERGGRHRTVCDRCGWEGPLCFGMKWESNNPKCAGGIDPSYWNEDEGSHKRPMCRVYNQCANEVHRQKAANLMTATQPMQPAFQPYQSVRTSASPPKISLPTLPATATLPPLPAMPTMSPPKSVQVRPPTMPQLPVMPPAQQVPQQQAQPQAPMPYYPQYMPYQQQQHVMMMVPVEQAQRPAYAPQNAMQPGAQAMAYIAVPESAGISYRRQFFGSVGRAMLKYGFLQAANCMDHIPWW